MLRLVVLAGVLAMASAMVLTVPGQERIGLSQPKNRTSVAPLRVGSKRFFLQTMKSNWYRAMEFCNYQGMRLATISSQEENSEVAAHIVSSGLGGEYFWVAGTDLAEQGRYVWMSTGEPMTYTNWYQGEPNHENVNGEVEHCVHLWPQQYGFTWNDKVCSTLYNFICEF